ncbi:hypothetical protein uvFWCGRAMDCOMC429_07 [Freshwater phage uvFW-CGR-AMD-COM-C429]|nr:hypothetical protein uvFWCGRAMDCOMC429_07 [Freshwater phage uvFW-CGR-AMD-COM-C429]
MLAGLNRNTVEPWTLLEVTWRDAYDAENGWTAVSTYKPEDQIARTVGYIWKDCQEHYITLCGTMFDSELPKVETVGNVTHIPIAMIQSVRILKQRRNYERVQIHDC